MKRYLVFDLGASSGRAIVIEYHNEISLHEVHRFKTKYIEVNNSLYWDIDDIFLHIKQGIKNAFDKFDNIISIGIDTWGVDYGILDKEGKLLRKPFFYRDERTKEVIDDLTKIISLDELYNQSGIQFQYFNTIFQLYADLKLEPEIYEKIDKVLLMPDLLAYLLTGEKRREITNFSTTGLYDPIRKDFIKGMKEIGIKESIFPEIIKPTETYGYLKDEIIEELNVPKIPVVATCSHDTASAILSIPLKDDEVYISSGTWSLCGTLLNEANISEEARLANFTNEVGFNHQIRFLKNVMGLWILNRTVQEFNEQGYNYSFSDVVNEAKNCTYFDTVLDPDNEIFENPKSMIKAIDTYCENSKQNKPEKTGEYFWSIYLSLALKYRYVFEGLSKVTNKTYRKIHIVGGGINVDILNQLTASLANMIVEIGPQEATVLGNVLTLMLNNGDIKDVASGHKLIQEKFTPRFYQPEDHYKYDDLYKKFKNLIKGEM